MREILVEKKRPLASVEMSVLSGDNQDFRSGLLYFWPTHNQTATELRPTFVMVRAGARRGPSVLLANAHSDRYQNATNFCDGTRRCEARSFCTEASIKHIFSKICFPHQGAPICHGFMLQRRPKNHRPWPLSKPRSTCRRSDRR